MKPKKVGTYHGYAIYEDEDSDLGVRKGNHIVPLMRQTEQMK